MVEIRFHGRAGQGMVTGAELLAIAAAKEKKHSQAFPIFGSEKRGPPVTSFCRISNEPIIVHEEISSPDIVVVADPSILVSVDVTFGLKENGLIIVNSPKKASELNLKVKNVFTIDGTKIALKNLKKLIYNTVMLGALVELTAVVKIENIKKAITEKFSEKFPQKIIDANILAVQECAEEIRKQKVVTNLVVSKEW